jgi:hypothetical protein
MISRQIVRSPPAQSCADCFEALDEGITHHAATQLVTHSLHEARDLVAARSIGVEDRVSVLNR